MKFRTGLWVGGVAVVVLGIAMALTLQRPPTLMVQHGYRGTGMDQVFNARAQALKAYANELPAAEPKADLAGVPSSQVYSNVQVLGDVDAAEFTRFMTAMTKWVAPTQGCAYCHSNENLASDDLYTKRVARLMIKMVRHINADWKDHVGGTGVTCFTCHRGQPVPAYVWFDVPAPPQTPGMLGNRADQDAPTLAPGMTSLPYDPFKPFLDENKDIRVVSTSALPDTNHTSIKQTEWTYSLMIHFTEALGVNCTFCHNTRSFSAWDQSTPQRSTAWYGIRMVRDINDNVLDPLKSILPPHRWGPLGDGPKVNCTTCHQGVYKPLDGASMLKDYEELATNAPPAATPAAAPATQTPAAPAAPVAPAVPAPAPEAPAPATPAPAPAAPKP